MVKLNNKSKSVLKSALNYNHEIGGKLHGNNILTINANIRKGPSISNRGTVGLPEHNKRYHTHPHISYPVPSTENVMSAFKKKSRHYSFVVTAWGVFIIENLNYNKNGIYNSQGQIKTNNETSKSAYDNIKKATDYIVHKISKSRTSNKIKTVPLNGELKKSFAKYLYVIHKEVGHLVHIHFNPW